MRGVLAAVCALAGVGLGYAIVVALKQSCVLYPEACAKIQFKRGPNKTLQLRDPRSGYMYFYDGDRLLYAYGSALAGVCPTLLASGATGTQVPAASDVVKDPCLLFAPDGTCTKRATCAAYAPDGLTCTSCSVPLEECERVVDAEGGGKRCADCDAAVARVYDGTLLGQGDSLMVPVFVMDTKTRKLLGDGSNPATCARGPKAVDSMFESVPLETINYMPEDANTTLDVYQALDVLQRRGIYVP